jgi:hypothetical protein
MSCGAGVTAAAQQAVDDYARALEHAQQLARAGVIAPASLRAAVHRALMQREQQKELFAQ